MGYISIVIILFVFLIILLVFEYLYRVYKWRTSFRTIFQKSRFPNLLYELKPNTSRYYRGEDYDKKILYATNKYGQRSPDFTLTENNRKKILVVGDSIPFGFGVEEKHTFPRFLEKDLNHKVIKTRVINAGMGTYNIIQDYWYIKHKGQVFKSDLVILCLNLSNLVKISDWIFDSKKNYVRPKYPEETKFKSNTRGLFGGKYSKVGKYLDKLYLFRFIIKPYIEKKLSHQNKKNFIGNIDQIKKYIEIYKSKTDKDFNLRIEYLSEIKNQCRAIGTELLVLIFPFTSQLENNFKDISLPQQLIIDYCKKRKIRVKSVLEMFQKNKHSRAVGYYYFDEVHLTKQGHKFVAQNLVSVANKIFKI